MCGENIGVGMECKPGCVKSTIECVQVVSQLLFIHRVGGSCLVVGDAFQAFPHRHRVVSQELVSQLLRVAPLSNIYLLCQGFFLPDYTGFSPISVGLFLSLMKVSEYFCESWFFIVGIVKQVLVSTHISSQN